VGGVRPFVPTAVEVVKVWIERKGDKYTGSFSLVYADGTESGVVTDVDSDCAALFRTMGISIGLTLPAQDARPRVGVAVGRRAKRCRSAPP
jgi:hypothetical protein